MCEEHHFFELHAIFLCHFLSLLRLLPTFRVLQFYLEKAPCPQVSTTL